jgi:hypothetical protein
MNPHELATRYVGIWNETDAARRRASVEALWAPDGQHFVRTLAMLGWDELERRVTDAHNKNVRDKGYLFRLSGDPQTLPGALLLHWDMVRAGHEMLEAYGCNFMLLAPDGRIAADYQFVLPTPRA